MMTSSPVRESSEKDPEKHASNNYVDDANTTEFDESVEDFMREIDNNGEREYFDKLVETSKQQLYKKMNHGTKSQKKSR